MNDTQHPSPMNTPARSALRVFLMFAIPVWLGLAVLAAVVIKLTIVPTFASTARVQAISSSDTVLAQLSSDATLTSVGERLQLEEKWGKIFLGSGQKLGRTKMLSILKMQVRIYPRHARGLIEIKVIGPKPQEAAQIANAIAEAGGPQTEIVRKAVPAMRPESPDKIPVIIDGFIAALVTFVLGGLAGLAGLAGMWLIRRIRTE